MGSYMDGAPLGVHAHSTDLVSAGESLKIVDTVLHMLSQLRPQVERQQILRSVVMHLGTVERLLSPPGLEHDDTGDQTSKTRFGNTGRGGRRSHSESGSDLGSEYRRNRHCIVAQSHEIESDISEDTWVERDREADTAKSASISFSSDEERMKAVIAIETVSCKFSWVSLRRLPEDVRARIRQTTKPVEDTLEMTPTWKIELHSIGYIKDMIIHPFGCPKSIPVDVAVSDHEHCPDVILGTPELERIGKYRLYLQLPRAPATSHVHRGSQSTLENGLTAGVAPAMGRTVSNPLPLPFQPGPSGYSPSSTWPQRDPPPPVQLINDSRSSSAVITGPLISNQTARSTGPSVPNPGSISNLNHGQWAAFNASPIVSDTNRTLNGIRPVETEPLPSQQPATIHQLGPRGERASSLEKAESGGCNLPATPSHDAGRRSEWETLVPGLALSCLLFLLFSLCIRDDWTDGPYPVTGIGLVEVASKIQQFLESWLAFYGQIVLALLLLWYLIRRFRWQFSIASLVNGRSRDSPTTSEYLS